MLSGLGLKTFSFTYPQRKKENVFRPRPDNIVNLKDTVREVISSINQDILGAVVANFEKRINLCIENQGGHFEHLL